MKKRLYVPNTPPYTSVPILALHPVDGAISHYIAAHILFLKPLCTKGDPPDGMSIMQGARNSSVRVSFLWK